MPLLQWSSSHSILSECRWLGEPELIPEFLIIRPAGRIRSARCVSEHAQPGETSPRGAQSWATRSKPGLLIISNSSLASLQTKCHLVPTGGVRAGSLTRWRSKQSNGNGKSFNTGHMWTRAYCPAVCLQQTLLTVFIIFRTKLMVWQNYTRGKISTLRIPWKRIRHLHLKSVSSSCTKYSSGLSRNKKY